MYCPVCGAESTQGLNYCKRCGASLGSPLPSPIDAAPQSRRANHTMTIVALVAAVIVVCAGGLGISLGISGGLVANGVNQDAPIAIAFCGSAVVLVVEIMLLRLLSKVIAASLSQPVPASAIQPAPQHIAPVALPAPPPSVSSVTENTTRNFEAPRYSERQQR